MADGNTCRSPWTRFIAACLFLVSAAPLFAVTAIDSFVYSSAAAARKAWQPSPSSPPVMPVPSGRGLVFPCTFDADRERVYWDRAVSLDLTRHGTIILDFACDDPGALRSPTLYFKSGNGWYVARIPMRGTGRRRVAFAKTDFSTEEKPTGWHRIERVRLSAWKADGRNARLTLYDLRADDSRIAVVRNTLSSPSEAERRYGTRVASRVARLLSDAGIPHGVLTDEEVIHGGLMKSRVAILTHHPHPPAREIESLKLFVRRGGKLIVFYGAEPALAELMGVRLGQYQKADAPGRWSSFTFLKPSFWKVPERVYQESSNIMPASPGRRSTHVIAYWEDSHGRRAEEPAWLASDNGLWMTHVLLDDDAANKRDMLTGLLASLDPAVWTYAAQNALERAGQIDSFRNFGDAHRRLSAAAESAPQKGRVLKLLEQADLEYQRMQASYSEGRHEEVVQGGRAVKEALVEAYARAQRGQPGEFRGVWEHNGTGWFPGDWDRTCRVLADHGINAVFPNMLWGGLAHYPSRYLPQSRTAAYYGDQLAQCVEAARKRGIEVHVWKVCWNVENAPSDFTAQMRKQGRLQVSHDGTSISWLCPSHPDNIALAIGSIREVVTNYAVQGIHLDYIRYPNANYCFCPTCRREFERETGVKVGSWPAEVRGKGKHVAAYRKWRAGKITSFVRLVREQVRALNASVKVSAAVWGAYPATVDSIGQDWGAWLKNNYVDFVCPMNYSTDNARFADLTRSQVALPGAKGRVFPGLGVTAAESQLGGDQVIEQILILRQLGARGFMLFDMSHTLRLDTLPVLPMGLTSE